MSRINTKNMSTKEIFLALTTKTYPNGHEEELYDILPDYFQKDEVGNLFIVIGDNPTTMFTAHLDTADYTQKNIKHVFSKDGQFIKTNRKTILGADDKAGVTVLLTLIEKGVNGLYYLFVGEEVGCIGSRYTSNNFQYKNIERCISFDRRGTEDIITKQAYGICASDEFASEFSRRLNEHGFNFKPCDTGLLTDSIHFMDFVPECTNVSVGYYNEHLSSETQDIFFLTNLCDIIHLIDFDTLPTKRKIEKISFDEKNSFLVNNKKGGVSTVIICNELIEEDISKMKNSELLITNLPNLSDKLESWNGMFFSDSDGKPLKDNTQSTIDRYLLMGLFPEIDLDNISNKKFKMF